MKTCSRCGESLPRDLFEKRADGALRPYCRSCKRLDAKPLQEWIKRKTLVYETTQALADACGVDEKVLRRVMQQKQVSLDLADRLLVGEGSTMLWELGYD